VYGGRPKALIEARPGGGGLEKATGPRLRWQKPHSSAFARLRQLQFGGQASSFRNIFQLVYVAGQSDILAVLLTSQEAPRRDFDTDQANAQAKLNP